MDQPPFYQKSPEPASPLPAVWPPAPQGSGLTQIDLRLPFQARYEFVQGTMADFRTGTLDFNPEGVLIDGKAIPRSEIRIPILIVCMALRLGIIIAWAIMEYAFRRPLSLQTNWDSIQQVVLNKKKNLVCMVYSAPNYKGVVKTFFVTTQTTPGYIADVEALLSQRIPERVTEGKLRRWTTPVAWIFLGAIIITIAVVLIAVSLPGATR